VITNVDNLKPIANPYKIDSLVSLRDFHVQTMVFPDVKNGQSMALKRKSINIMYRSFHMAFCAPADKTNANIHNAIAPVCNGWLKHKQTINTMVVPKSFVLGSRLCSHVLSSL